MMTDRQYWDREQFYEAVGRELKRRNLAFNTDAQFDLIIPREPTGRVISGNLKRQSFDWRRLGCLSLRRFCWLSLV